MSQSMKRTGENFYSEFAAALVDPNASLPASLRHSVTGRHEDAATTGALFDAASDGLIFDQRLLWVTVLFVIFTRGPGTLSLDKLLGSEMHTNEI